MGLPWGLVWNKAPSTAGGDARMGGDGIVGKVVRQPFRGHVLSHGHVK